MSASTAVLFAPAGVTQVFGVDGVVYAVDASGQVTVPVTMIPALLGWGFLLSSVEPGSITNAMIATGAAIDYVKLALTGHIIDGDISSGAAISLSKIASPVPKLLSDRVLSTPGLAMGSDNTALANVAFTFQVGAASAVVNTLNNKAAVAAGTAFGALGTIPASKWGLILAQIAADGTVTFVSAAANYTTGYDDEASAIAAVPAATAAHAVMGYVTILASASTWIAGTDALATGTGGNPADTTNYYNAGLGY